MDTFTRSETHENDDFSDFWKVKVKSYSSNMKQNYYMQVVGQSFIKNYKGNGPTDPLGPQIRDFPISHIETL